MFKKIRLNLALISCVLLFITACDESTENKVNLTENDIRILEQRVAIMEVLNEDQNCSSSSAEAQFNKMRAISLKGCPHKFTAAYLKHLDAWHRAARLERKYNSLQGGLEIIWDTLTLSKSPFYDEEAKEITDDVNTTYRECLSIAAEYGVNISEYK